ncbi:60S ribosomal protein L24 [Diplocarpon rosae]|nr:60S ribosomal protein L24 [Diplocarpon rosae]
MAAHTYTSAYPPGVQVDAGIKTFFEEFYQTSDSPDAHDRYTEYFTKDATLIMASKKGVGRDVEQLGYTPADTVTLEERLLVKGEKYIRPADQGTPTEILAIRKGAWALVSSRLHTPSKIFPFGEGADELMLCGSVQYVLRDGRKSEVEWAARANLVKVEGEWKLSFYQVYLDTAAMQNAK